MAHRAALYTVRVRKKGTKDDYQLLGDYDGHGHFLADTLRSYLNGFELENAEGSKIVRCEAVVANGDELQLKLSHGESGVTAVISDDAGAQQYRQRSSDIQALSCGGLFVLPRAQTRGWLALHVNAGRGVKGLLGKGLIDQFMEHHDNLRLEITPFVERSVLEQAVDKGKVNRIRLLRSVPPNDRADAAVDRWLPPQLWGKIEVQIRPQGRAEHVKAALLSRYLRGDSEVRKDAFPEIVEFAGMEFDEAKVEVELENRARRTFNIEHPDSGHALTVDLDENQLDVDADGEANHDRLIEALRDALQTVL